MGRIRYKTTSIGTNALVQAKTALEIFCYRSSSVLKKKGIHFLPREPNYPL